MRGLPRPDQPKASVIIRTYNEARHLPEVLKRLAGQDRQDFEVIVVDSGSTDKTVAIAELAGARLVHIEKSQFTFGRSLNMGCEAARGDVLIFISGHCYPMNRRFVDEILKPYEADEKIALVYGMQRGGKTTKFSEHCHFIKTFPREPMIPQEGFFCNNANCSIRRSLWEQRPFNEALTGLEDLEWAKWATEQGWQAAYSAKAGVYHLHDETWKQVFRRYEREAIALKNILPDVSFSLFEFVRLFFHSLFLDCRYARRRRQLTRRWKEIAAFRLLQYWGTYCGVHYHKKLTKKIKERFFYPNK
ncbi:MAG: glycosyltransferase family 2 protein [Sumerlaeia bacterium]